MSANRPLRVLVKKARESPYKEKYASNLGELTFSPRLRGTVHVSQESYNLYDTKMSASPCPWWPLLEKYRLRLSSERNGEISKPFVLMVVPRLVAFDHVP